MGHLTRMQAKRAFWAGDHPADVSPRVRRCPSGVCHAEAMTPAQVAEMYRQRGLEPPGEDGLLPTLPRGRAAVARPEYVVCPGCGAGWGRPHFERCRIEVPSYAGQGNLYAPLVTGLTAYSLAIFPLALVRRSTIRAMLPRGETRVPASQAAKRAAGIPKSQRGGTASVNDTSVRFQNALRGFSRRGWIRREGGDCCVIVARYPLRRTAERLLDGRPDLISGAREAIAALAASFPEPATVEGRAQRDRELAALRRLMEDAPAQGPHGGRGYVQVHGAKDLI
jgi:hypothetical protein